MYNLSGLIIGILPPGIGRAGGFAGLFSVVLSIFNYMAGGCLLMGRDYSKRIGVGGAVPDSRLIFDLKTPVCVLALYGF